MPQQPALPVSGSGVSHLPGAVRAGRVSPAARLQVTLILHPRDPAAHRYDGVAIHPAARQVMSRASAARLYDPGATAIALVRRFAAAHKLAVIATSKIRHDVVLEGSVAAVSKAFGVTLHYFRHAGGRYRAHDEPVQLPPDLAPAVIAVLGLDDIPVHRPHLARAAKVKGSLTASTPAQLEQHYNFPDTKARGKRIALIQFAGGFRTSDISGFTRRHGLELPPVTAIGVMGADGKRGRNNPLSAKTLSTIATAYQRSTSFATLTKKFGADFTAFLATFEVTMDVETAVAMGGGAAIDVYFAPSGVDGWRRVLYAALGEPVEGGAKASGARPTAISVSWGENEANIGETALRVLNDVLHAAERLGVTICCASGDRGTSNVFAGAGSTGCAAVNANFPASSPAVVACGGTTLTLQPAGKAAEISWKQKYFQTTLASGGGMSGFFARPAFQSGVMEKPVTGSWTAPAVNKTFVGRWIPDLAANAAFASGLSLRVGGVDVQGGGTSAATPLIASLLTRMSATLKHPMAGLTGWLYAESRRSPCRDITSGDNAVCAERLPFYTARRGWDACTGWGAPDGARLMAALSVSLPKKRVPKRSPTRA